MTQRVIVELDPCLMRVVDEFCGRFGMADRGEAIGELLMLGLSWTMPDRELKESPAVERSAAP